MIVNNGSLLLSGGKAWALNPVYLVVTADPGHTVAGTYFLRVKIREGSLANPVFAEFQLVPNAAGQMIVQLQGYIEAWLRENTDRRPNLSSALIQPYTPNTFFVTLEEVIDAVTNTVNLNFPAILAGLDENTFAYATQAAWVTLPGKFLTGARGPKPTSRDAREWLYLWVQAAGATFRIKCTITYIDGTTQTFTPLSVTANYDADVAIIPCSFANLGLAAYDNVKEIESYSIFAEAVSGGGAVQVLSEAFSFSLYEQECVEKRIFMFRNSLGAYETVLAAGELATSLGVEREVAQRSKNYQPDYSKGERVVVQSRATRSGEAATAWVPEHYRESLQAFLLSNEIYELIGNNYRPVIIEQADYDYTRKSEDLIGLSFSYIYANEPELYTYIR